MNCRRDRRRMYAAMICHPEVLEGMYMKMKLLLLHYLSIFLVCANMVYEREGDLKIGVLTQIRISQSLSDKCGNKIIHPRMMQYMEAFAYIIDQINRNKNLLPNTPLGFVFLDHCNRPSSALVHAMQFLPQKYECYNNSDHAKNLSDVIAVVGMMPSSVAVLISPLLGYFEIPVIAATSTLQDLSDKEKYPYFLRVFPSDQYQANAITAILMHFNWTYIAILYSDNQYGEGGFKNIARLARESGICIAYSHEIAKHYNDTVNKQILYSLLTFRGVRAVILFANTLETRNFLKVSKHESTGTRFVWIGSEGLGGNAYTGVEEISLGSFFMSVETPNYHPFQQYFESLTPGNNPWNPIYPMFWEDIFGCNWNNETCRKLYSNITQADDYYFSKWPYSIMDAVLVVAHGLHNLLNQTCSSLFRRDLRNCISGKSLYTTMLDSNFQGITGNISFDRNGDVLMGYTINQLVKSGDQFRINRVGIWDMKTKDITMYMDKVQFYGSGHEIPVPTSVCSQPCDAGYQMEKSDVPCCWTCHPCRADEFLASNNSVCATCPPFTWPDTTTRRECLDIEASYLSHTDVTGLIIIISAAFGCIFSLIVCIIFSRHKNKKAIKTSSVHIMFLILLGTALNSMASTAVVVPAGTIVCYIRNVSFHLACTILYGALATKTIRIYRFFSAAAQYKCRLKCVGPVETLLLSMTPIIIQIGLLAILMTIYPPAANQHQPVEVEKYVELRCVTPAVSFLAPLTLNLLLLAVCATFGFLTRKLPDCFNESLCIFFSVVTTLVVWAAFLPTYYLIFYAYYKDMLLAIALLLNCYIFLFGLFGPKIYAVYYLREEDIKTSTFETEFGKTVHSVSTVTGSLGLPDSFNPEIDTVPPENTNNT